MKKALSKLKIVDKIVIVAFAITLLQNLWLNHVPEYFSLGSDIGIIVDKLSLSFVSAYIFYYVNIRLKQRKDRAIIYPYVKARANNVVGCCYGMLSNMSESSNVTFLGRYPLREELHNICRSLRLNQAAPLLQSTTNGDFSNWQNCFLYYIQRSDSFSEKIFLKISFLDADLVRLITDIRDCTFFTMFKGMRNLQATNQDLTFAENTIWDYILKIKKLDDYIEANLKDYN